MLLAIKNPQYSGKFIKKPIIKFVENYSIGVTWSGYARGEVSKVFNMFPGETREITISTSTSRSISLSSSQSTSQSTSTKSSTSIENSLQNELSRESKLKKQHAEESILKNESTNQTEDESKRSKSSTTKAKVSASYGGVGGSGSQTNTKSTQNSTKKMAAINASDELRESSSSEENLSEVSKNIQSVVQRVASDVSSDNKVEITQSSEESLTESSSSNERLTLKNPNQGTPLNYLFYQLQNLYKYNVHLEDIQIVVDTGVEILSGTKITEKRACSINELPQFLQGLFNDFYDVENATANIDISPGSGEAAVAAEEITTLSIDELLPNKCGAISLIGLEIASAIARRYEKIIAVESGDKGSEFLDRLKNWKGLPDALLLQTVLGASSWSLENPLKEKEESRLMAVNSGSYFMDVELSHNVALDDFLISERGSQNALSAKEVELMAARIQTGQLFPPVSKD